MIELIDLVRLQKSISLIVLSQCRRRKEQNREHNDYLFHISSFSSGQICILQAKVIFAIAFHVPPGHPEAMKRTSAANVQTHSCVF